MVVGAERIGEIVAHPEFARLAEARVVDHDDNTGAVGRRRRHAEGHRLAFVIVGEDGDFLRDEAGQRVVARARRIGTGRRSQSIDAERQAHTDRCAVKAHRRVAHCAANMRRRGPGPNQAKRDEAEKLERGEGVCRPRHRAIAALMAWLHSSPTKRDIR